jgi:hypothetical protein
MPQVPDPNEGWISMDRLMLPRQALEISEIDEFLRYIFGDIARRPDPLRLRETAEVVRFIKRLTSQGVPRAVANEGADVATKYRSMSPEQSRARWYADQIAEIIWNTLLQSGEFPTAAKSEALNFLSKHRQTYLANPYFDEALAFVEAFELPAHAPPMNEPPAFRSRSRTVRTYASNARLKSDLSERIYIADEALKRAGLKTKRRPVIGRALEDAAVEHRSGDTTWTSEEVNERVKEYQRSQRLQWSKRKVKWTGEHLVDDRIHSFRLAQSGRKASSETSGEGS